jgi:signal transduction histidine kinase
MDLTDMGPPDEPQHRGVLRGEFRKQDLPRHLALFYEDKTTQLDTVTAFIEHGLSTGHKCLYLYDVSTAQQIRDALSTATDDVEHHLETGALELCDASEVYLDSGFDPNRMIETLEAACEESLADGYEGLYVAGENSWCFHTDHSFDHILDFEADFDAVCPELSVFTLCQYDLDRFGEESAAKALWTHEKIIYRNQICENPFYIPPREYQKEADTPLNISLMLRQASSLTEAQQEIRQHEQRLEVLNRVFRHNIRNNLNVIKGNIAMAVESEAIPADVEERLRTSLKHAEKTIQKAEQARYLQESLGTSSTEAISIDQLTETVCEEVSSDYPDADIRITGPRDIEVLADTRLDRAIVEALTNAITHQHSDSPRVTITISTPTEGTARIDIQNPGEIPDVERKTIQQGYETQLTHSSGLGLWLIQWVVENSHGKLTFPDINGDGVTLRIELTRLPS